MTKEQLKSLDKKTILKGVGVIAAILIGYFVFDYFMYVSTDNAQIEGHFVLLTPKVGGFIVKVNVEEGQHVKKGDVLVEIDPRDYENTLHQVSGELTSSEARKNDAEKTYQRMSQLKSSGAISSQQYDTASASYAEAKAKWEAVKAQVSQAQLNLDNTKIVAPSDGYIAKKSVEVGQLASPGIPLVGFVDANERWVTANFKETDLRHLHKGAHVKISVDAIDGRKFEGRVEAISAATGSTFTLLPPDNASGNFTKVVQRVPVKVSLTGLKDNDAELLRVGLSAYVKVSIH
jgi:membrane fusion protein (multidrug efflux system)